MTITETKLGWLCLILAMTLSAGLFAGGSRESNAYFVDVQSGTISGSYAGDVPAPTSPFRLEPGTSKALHWGPGDDAPASGLPIAQLDLSGTIYLDFGEAPAGHGDSRPDVFRIVSLADEARDITFSIDGEMNEFISVVRIGEGESGSLPARDTSRVYMKVRIPSDAAPGTYTGTLTVHVQGWAEDARLPMTIDVVGKKAKATVAPQTSLPSEVATPVPSVEISVTAPPSVEATSPVPVVDPGTLPGPIPGTDATGTPVPTSTPVPTPTVGVSRD